MLAKCGQVSITYVKLVALTGNTELNRCVLQCAPQLKVLSGSNLFTGARCIEIVRVPVRLTALSWHPAWVDDHW